MLHGGTISTQYIMVLFYTTDMGFSLAGGHGGGQDGSAVGDGGAVDGSTLGDGGAAGDGGTDGMAAQLHMVAW
jgi:hypothetical protein